jgi:hypothetical protein
MLSATCSPSTFSRGCDLLESSSRQRVLCSAPTNVAVHEMAAKFLSKFFEMNGTEFLPTDIQVTACLFSQVA